MTGVIDKAAATKWILGKIETLQTPLRFTQILGGLSNLTFKVEDSSGLRFILRRPPLFASSSAHNVGREFRIIEALQNTSMPVPRVIAFEADETVLGAPFYVMHFVDGYILRQTEDIPAAMSQSARARVSANLVDILFSLHAFDPDQVRMGGLGQRDNYVERQLRTWFRQLNALSTDQDRLQLLVKCHSRLERDVPRQQASSILHGDFRLDNVVVSIEGAVEGVLDWELCALGDPIADLATFATYWTDPEDGFAPLGASATDDSGFWSRDQVIAAYRERSSLDFGRFDYYLALANWKLAVILEGVYMRHLGGAYGVSPDTKWRHLESTVPMLGDRVLGLV